MSDAPEWEDMADWSGLPEVYLTKVQRQQGMFWRVEACSVPMAIGPEVPLVVRHPAVLAELQEVKAMIAAALRELISLASEWASETFDGDPVSIADWLNASTPDAKAALDAYVAAEVRKALEGAADAIADLRSVPRAQP